MRVRNSGAELLELVLEPYGSDHWVRPGETFVIWTIGRPGDGVSEAFAGEHGPGTVTVHADVLPAYVGDEDGNEIDCGHHRPQPAGPFRLNLPQPLPAPPGPCWTDRTG
ncbi:hypothetical protein QA802_28225 [Streptomyces sp. B21-105]|uniref:hypothetical protein n=1 Tax=Streptomyces sp. B21-105 TaxID=3039417 RepID=UPI002FEEB9B0